MQVGSGADTYMPSLGYVVVASFYQKVIWRSIKSSISSAGLSLAGSYLTHLKADLVL